MPRKFKFQRQEEPLTLEGVQEILESRKSARKTLITEIQEDLAHYFQDYELDVPEEFHVIRSPAANTVSNRAADRIGSGRFLVHMDPRSGSIDEKKRVEKMEKAGAALLWIMRRRSKYNPIRGMALHCFNRGAAVAKLQIDDAAFVAEPARSDFGSEASYTRAKKLWLFQRLSRFPVVLDVRPIESIFPDPETDGDNDVIEYYRRSVGDLRRNYPNWDGWKSLTKRDGKGRFASGLKYRDDDTVEFIEVNSREQRAVIVNNEFLPIGNFPAGPVPNPFGRPPLWIRYSGFGDPSGAPEQRCVSVVRYSRDVLRSMSRLLSIVDTQAENEAWGATIAKSGDSGVSGFSFAPSALNEMDYPEMVRRIRNEGLNPTLLNALGLMGQIVDTSTVPSEAIGQQPRDRRVPPSGVAAAILTGQASMIIDPVNEAIEDALSEIMSFTFFLFDGVIEEELPLYGQVGEREFVQLTLDKKTIDGHYGPVYVKNLLRAPEEDYARMQLGAQFLQVGAPLEYVLEDIMHKENARAMVDDMLRSRILQHPKVLDFLVDMVLRTASAQISLSPPAAGGVAAPLGAPPAISPNGQGLSPVPGTGEALLGAEAGVVRQPRVIGGQAVGGMTSGLQP